MAAQEHAVERELDRLGAELGTAPLPLVTHEPTGAMILGDVAPLLTIVDEHTVAMMRLRASPHRGPFAQRIAQSEGRLTRVADTLSAFRSAQRRWLMLR